MATIRLRDGHWYLNYTTANGKRIQKSLRTKDHEVALLVLKKIEKKMAIDNILKYNNDNDNTWVYERWSTFTPKERFAVLFFIFKGKCFYCKKPVFIYYKGSRNKSQRAVIDHKIPVSAGGSDQIDNLVLACNDCNTKKFDRCDYEFLAELDTQKWQKFVDKSNRQKKEIVKTTEINKSKELIKMRNLIDKESRQRIKELKRTFLERHIKN